MKMRKILLLALSAAIAASPANVFAAGENSGGQEALNQSEAAAVAASQMLEDRDYEADQLIVTYDSTKKNQEIREELGDYDASCEKIRSLNEEEKMAQVAMPEETDLAEAIAMISRDPEVISVQPNYRYRLQDVDPMTQDGSRMYQYFHKMIRDEAAWDILETEGNQKAQTTIAIIDTGVDAKHEDLQANLVRPGSYDSVVGGKTVSVTDDSGEHGTHIAGILGATYGNGLQGCGMAVGHNNDLVRILPVGSSPDGEYIYTFDVVNAVKYAVDAGARVVNMSFGQDGRDRVMENAILDGYEKGVVFVGASGNESSNVYSDPDGMKEVISVVAVNDKGNAAYYSNYGNATDVAAPGTSIYSTLPGSQFGIMSGTSMASPMVAGVAALMLDAAPELTPAQVYNIICASTGKTEYDSKGLAYGLVDAEACVRNAMEASEETPAESLYVKKGDYSVYVGDDMSLEALVRPATSLAKVTWTSADPSIAEVDPETGKVTGKTPGSVMITAEAGGHSDLCQITVLPAVGATEITISKLPYQNEMAPGQAVILSAVITPSDASNQEVYWDTSDREVLDVDETGYVLAVGVGRAEITARNYDGSVRTSAVITVRPACDRVRFTKTVKWLQLGDRFTFAAQLLNKEGKTDVAHNHITWRSSNSSIARVNAETGAVTPVKPGTAYIMAEYTNPMVLSDLNYGANGDYYRVAMAKLVIAKKNYKGKDYGLKQIRKTKKSVTLSWKKIPIAEGYVIQAKIKKKGKFKVIKVIRSGSTVKFRYSTKKNKYYRIRAYYTKNGKRHYFSYSGTVYAKVRK